MTAPAHMSEHALAAPPLVLLDSITQVDAGCTGKLVVCGSHGGASAGHYALAVRAWLYVFNDAGVGKDNAGIVALAMLAERGIAAATVAHTSARIGEASDSWAHGVVTHVNAPAAARGIAARRALRAQLAPA